MKHIKTAAAAVIIALAAASAASAGGRKDAAAPAVVKIGVTSDVFKAAWEKAAELTAADNIAVEVVLFGDYITPNRALAEGEIDLNSFQHNAFLRSEIQEKGYAISPIGNTIVTFLGVYSHKIKSLDELQNGDTIVLMNDPTNEGLALKALEAAGVFTLDPAKGNAPAPRDIIANPRNIKLVEVDAALTYRQIDDPLVSAVVAPSNIVFDAGLIPSREAIFIKPIDLNEPDFINIIAARTAEKDNPVYQKLVAAFQTPEVAQVIEKQSGGMYLPVWR